MKYYAFYLFILSFIIFSCKKDDVQGCTDSAATNYNSDATIDDGSCIYPTPQPQIFDIVGKLQLNDGPHDIVMKDNIAIACRGEKIWTISLSNVNTPTIITEYDDFSLTNSFETVALSDDKNTLYAGCSESTNIYVFSISSSGTLTFINKFPQNILGADFFPKSIFCKGQNLYVGGSDGTYGVLVKYTISGNSLAVDASWKNSVNTSGVEGVWANDNYCFVSSAMGHIYSFNNNTIHLGPLDDFTFTNEAGHEHWGKNIVGDGTKLYWADWGAGFVTLNISNPNNLNAASYVTNSSFKSQFPDAEGTDFYDIAIDPNSNKIFLANGWSGLIKVDKSNTASVENYVDYQYHQYYCLALYGDYAVAGNISGGMTGYEKGIKIIKVK